MRRFYWGASHVDFVGRYRVWFGISGLRPRRLHRRDRDAGLNFSIDFEGGTVWQRARPTRSPRTQAEHVAADNGLEGADRPGGDELDGQQVTCLESRAGRSRHRRTR